MKTIRCAIYTRKSSDEGLEQAFNSLDAQREACAAYVLSQTGEGWSALPDRYDDGGISGGTLERPALKRLLADVADGKIDVVVVYKIDRLSRSLFDFAKLAELFEKAGTSFVSVTQAFSTTTSMGRLTLNMLLSFAQFEREVTAERIRDKIAASKRKGLWMGGNPPIGYRPDGRSLAIVEDEAAQVRDIFQRYLKLGNVRRVAEALERDGVTTPARVNGKGKAYGGIPWYRGPIYKLLSNPIYLGLIEHRGERYPGLHLPIIDHATWDAVQAKLADNLQGHRTGQNYRDTSLLRGKVVDEAGQALIVEHACKGKVRHKYYVTRRGTGAELRIAARELDQVVVERLRQAFADPIGLAIEAGLELQPQDVVALGKCVPAELSVRSAELVRGLVSRVRIAAQRIEIRCSVAAIAGQLGVAVLSQTDGVLTLSSSARVAKSGRVVKLVDSGGVPLVPFPDGALIRLVAKAHSWWRELRKGDLDVTALAKQEGVQPAYVTRVVRLAFLSPTLISATLGGRSTALTIHDLTLGAGVPTNWCEQQPAPRLAFTGKK